MPLIAQVFAFIAALLHLLFFYNESVTFTRPSTWRRFGLQSQEQAEIVRPMAYNQGFYNLFLALGIVIGLVLVTNGSVEAGRAVVVFACACMVLAGIVLIDDVPGDAPRGPAPGHPAAARDRRDLGPLIP